MHSQTVWCRATKIKRGNLLGYPGVVHPVYLGCGCRMCAHHLLYCVLAFQSSQARISALYLPLLTIIIENKTRLQTKYSAPAPPGLAVNGDAQSELSNRWSSTLGSYTSQASLDQASLSSGLSSISQQRPAVRDPNVFSLISGQSGQFLCCLNLQPVLLNFHWTRVFC